MQIYALIALSLTILVKSADSAILNFPRGRGAAGADGKDAVELSRHKALEPHEPAPKKEEILDAAVLVKRQPQAKPAVPPAEAVARQLSEIVFTTVTLTTRVQVTRTTTITRRRTTAITLPGLSSVPASRTDLAPGSGPQVQIITVDVAGNILQDPSGLNGDGGEIDPLKGFEIQIIGQGLPNITVTLGDLPPAERFLSLPGLDGITTPLTITKTNGAASTRPQSGVVATSSAQNNPATPTGFKTLPAPK